MTPTTEKMIADLRGKIPDEVHSVLVETGAWLDAMEQREFARASERYLRDNGDGTVTIMKPPRFLSREA